MSSCMSLWPRYLLLAVVVMRGGGEMMCEPDAYGLGPSSESARPRLRQDLLCEYDTEVQPQRNMSVAYEMFVRRARVEHRTLEMKVLINLRWKDPFLVWDPARYDGVEQMQINSKDIWTPDVATISTLPWIREEAGEGAYQSDVWPSTCRVAADGTVTCAGAMDVGGACSVSYLYWPHVEATCGTVIGSDFRTGKDIYIRFYNDSLQTELLNYVPDNDWVVTDASREYFQFGDDGEGGALTYTFKLHSRGAVILAGLTGPGIVLSLMLLASFALPTLTTTRIGLCCCSTFGTVLVSSQLLQSLPPYHGPNPVIVTFYSALLVLSAIAIVMTLLLNILTPRAGKPPCAPRWLYAAQSWLLNSPKGKLLLNVLLLAPRDQNVCQAIELLPALNMQTQESAGRVHDGEDGNEDASPTPQRAPDLQESSSSLSNNGPHRIWDFTVSFVNRTMFLIFLLACGILSLCLLHAMATYKDVDFSIFG